MGSLGWPEILLIGLVVVLFFGARRLPDIGKGLGEGIRSFRNSMRGDERDRSKDDGGETPGSADR